MSELFLERSAEVLDDWEAVRYDGARHDAMRWEPSREPRRREVYGGWGRSMPADHDTGGHTHAVVAGHVVVHHNTETPDPDQVWHYFDSPLWLEFVPWPVTPLVVLSISFNAGPFVEAALPAGLAWFDQFTVVRRRPRLLLEPVPAGAEYRRRRRARARRRR